MAEKYLLIGFVGVRWNGGKKRGSPSIHPDGEYRNWLNFITMRAMVVPVVEQNTMCGSGVYHRCHRFPRLKWEQLAWAWELTHLDRRAESLFHVYTPRAHVLIPISAFMYRRRRGREIGKWGENLALPSSLQRYTAVQHLTLMINYSMKTSLGILQRFALIISSWNYTYSSFLFLFACL